MIDVLKAYLQVATGVGEVTRQRAVEAARQALAASPAGLVLPVATAGVEGVAAQASALADELLETGRQNRELLRQLVRAEVETVVTRLGLGGTADLQAQLAASRTRVRELEETLASGTSGRAVTLRATTEAMAAALAPDATSDGTSRDDAVDLDAPVRAAREVAAERGQAAAKASTAKESTARKSTAKKSTAKKSTAKKSVARSSVEKSPATTSTPATTPATPTAKKSAPATSTSKKSAPATSASTRSTAKKSTAKKSTAKDSTAKKSTAKDSTANSTAKKSTAKKSTAKESTAKKSTAKTSAAGARASSSTGPGSTSA